MKAEVFAGKYQKPDSEDPDTRQPHDLVRDHRLQGPVPRRKEGSPGERIQEQSACRKLTWTTKSHSNHNRPLHGHRGEGFFLMPQTESHI